MPAFRELTSRRVQAFVDQRLFSVFDYVRDPLKFQVGAVPVCAALHCAGLCRAAPWWVVLRMVCWAHGGKQPGGLAALPCACSCVLAR